MPPLLQNQILCTNDRNSTISDFSFLPNYRNGGSCGHTLVRAAPVCVDPELNPVLWIRMRNLKRPVRLAVQTQLRRKVAPKFKFFTGDAIVIIGTNSI